MTTRHSTTALIACGVVAISTGGAFAQTRLRVDKRPAPHVRAEWAQRYQEARLGPEQSERYSKTIKAGRGATLDLQNVSGSITVTGTGGDEIVIEAVKRARARTEDRAKAILRDLDIHLIDRPGRVTIRTFYPRMTGSVSAAVDYTVRVPQDAAVDLKFVSGDLRISNVKGAVRLETVNGSVHAAQAPRLEYAKSVSGTVEITGNIDGELTASSLTGAVLLKDLKVRALEVTTISGDVVLNEVLVDRARVRSVEGDLQFVGALVKNGRYDMNSHSGRIRLTLPSSVGFEVDASTYSGNLRSDLPLTITGRDRDDRRPTPPPPPKLPDSARARSRLVVRVPRSQTIRGTVGDASAYLVIRTFSGDILIEKSDRKQ